jgi:Protein of unknown function (DUF1579)
MERSTERPEGKMDMQAMMAVMKTLGTPGAAHKLLAGMAGSWKAEVKTWTAPERPSLQSVGTAEQEMILGGRFLRQEFSSNMMGMPYTGIGFTGYDNHTKRYVSTWMDTTNTGIMYFAGEGSADGKTITQETAYLDNPMRGTIKWRSVTKIVDDNIWIFELYGVDKQSKAERMMEITYSRK